jgi:ABC-type oligopeptide transport system substrate-binding subunit/transcriptional regulator with XRE-family HTH domain
LALDLTQAALARRTRCSPAAIKKIEHDERRPSRTMAVRLAEALDIPSDQRDQFVAASVGDVSPAALGGALAPAAAGLAPPWLSSPLGADRLRLVCRDDELARLNVHLHATLGGHGRVVFVTGEAGQGKTALLTSFADAAQRQSPDLVAARGAGTAVGGYGDPYLAFRDVFRTLVADPHAAWHAPYVTTEQAASVWDFAPRVAQTIDAAGPHLLDVVVPADTVRDRLGFGTGPVELPRPSRDHVVAEVTDVLSLLAAERPLLIVLDDMQWADTASAELLFHLSRRLTGTRLLVVCAYRSSETTANGPAGEALRRALAETRRQVPDARIDLDHVGPAVERALCDALLDLEVPNLTMGLRDEIFRRTRGHPLFVQELIRELKARGDLVRRADGYWAGRDGLDWNHVPARVAAVIEQRMDRLEPDEQTLLEAAAVEGEHFTVEVTARVAGLTERLANRLLAKHLDRRHGLVQETETVRPRDHALTRYRFRHVLFQRYLYEALSERVRERLHGQVAAELERLHASDVESVVPQLAHHYAMAGDAERAVPYLIRAGDRARLLCARDDATDLYERAVRFLRQQGDRERLARTMMRIGLTHQAVFDHDRAQQAFDAAFRLWSTGGQEARKRSEPAGTATLRLTWSEPETLDPTRGVFTVAGSVITNLLSGLVRYDEGTNLVPDVAERWEISDDGRRYVFHLREDVFWSDGRPVTAHDFEFTYQRALDPAAAGSLAPMLLDAVSHARDARAGRVPLEKVGVHAVDDHTLMIELSEPASYFIYNLAYCVLLPVPQHTVKEHGDGWCQPETMVSNGPFRLANWEPGRIMVFERNPRYHGPTRGNVARVNLDLAAPTAELEARYLADQVDALSSGWFGSEEVIDRLRRRFPAEHSSRDSFVTVFYCLGVGTPPLDDRRLRQAMAMAVDRTTLVARGRHGQPSPASGGLVPPGMSGHVPNLVTSHDPQTAGELVAAVSAEKALPEIAVLARQGNEVAAQQLCADWRAIGIPGRVQTCSWTDFLTTWSNASGPKVGVTTWFADYPDPDSFLRFCVELYLPDWRHDRYRMLVEHATRSTDPADRLVTYEEAERILAEEAAIVPLMYESEHLLLKPWVTEYPSVPVKYPGFWKDVVVGPR